MGEAAVRCEGIDDTARLSARQLALAAAVSLLVHAGAAALVLAPQYEEARLAGGGASFGLSGGHASNASGTDSSVTEASETGASDTGASDTGASDTGAIGTDGAVDRMMAVDENGARARPDESAAPSPATSTTAAPDAPKTAQAPDALDPASEPRLPPDTRQTLAKPLPVPRPDRIRPERESGARAAARTAQSAAARRSATRRGESAGRTRPSRSADRTPGPAARRAEPAPAGQAAHTRSQGRSQSGYGSATGSAESGAGDAASSNYTGLVTEHIRRNRRSNAVGAGQAIVKLTIAPDGGLRDLDIYRSSGSTRFDRQALRMVRLAAPYPQPPAGQGPVLVRLRGR